MKFENIRTTNFENAIRGMRNPKDSWHLSDTYHGINLKTSDLSAFTNNQEYKILQTDGDFCEYISIGPKDLKLAKTLIKGGSEHRKFLRQIFISIDITAPLYVWKEFDTYKVGTTANSTSTMHTLTNKPITLESFEIDDYKEILIDDVNFIKDQLIPYLEYLRSAYLQAKEEGNDELAYRLWKHLVRWLPEGWLQTRTVTMNYENALNIIHQRNFHKLNEWSGVRDKDLPHLVNVLKSLPYMDEFLSALD